MKHLARNGANTGGAAVLMTLALALLCTSCAVLKEAGPGGPVACDLEYVAIEDADDTFGYVGSTYEQMSRRPRKKLEDEPIYFSKRPHYASKEFGGLGGENDDATACVFVVDESKGTTTGYETLYVDANGDGSLNDEAQVTGTPNTYTRDGEEVQDWRQVEFPAVELKVAYGDKTHPYRVKPSCRTYSDTSMSLRSAGYCRGELELAGETYAVALVDDTCNGRFNDPYGGRDGSSGSIYGSGDALVIDTNQDGEFDKDHNPTAELYRLGRHLVFNGTSYDLDVSPCGRRLSLTPTASPCGVVTLSQELCEVELMGDGGTLKLDSVAGKSRIPVGEYRFATCRLEEKTAGGNVTWGLVGKGDWSQSAVAVTENGKAHVVFGPPLIAKVTVSKREAQTFAFDFALSGQGGETYTAGDVTRNGKSIGNAPFFKILDKEGKQVARGNFEYG